MQKIAVGFSLLVLLATTAFAQSPTLRIVTDDPALPSELFYGNVKVKPVRVRPGTDVRITIDDSDFFVQEHYLDFLSRFPEAQGFQSWMTILNSCNNDPGCLYGPNGKRILVSQSFFGSPEYLIKGRYGIGFYLAALNRLPEYAEFAPDLRSLTGTTAAETNAKRAAFADAFVQRTEFVNIYGGMSNQTYVNTLMARYGLTSITTPDPANPDGANMVTLTINDLINGVNGGTLTRAQVLRAIVQSDQVTNAEAVHTFVASQYYGYLRRTPETQGFNDWVNYLTTHPGDFNTMVWGFVDSQEYRNRF
jgi:hypothetical protein